MALARQESQPDRRTTAAHELLSRRPAAERVYSADLLFHAFIDSLKKFDPRTQVRNPVMFVVLLGAMVTAALTVDPPLFGPTKATVAYNAVVTAILLVTVWFANLAEAIAEGRGKAKAATLRQTKTELIAKRVGINGNGMFSSALTMHTGIDEPNI